METNHENQPESLDDDPVSVGKGLDASREIPVSRVTEPAAPPPAVGGKGWLRTFSSLQVRNFRWYWISVIASFVAMQMQMIARGWLIYTLTDSPLALGLMGIAWGVPMMVLGPFGGVIADRVEKRNLIVITQVLVGLVTLVVTILIVTGAIQFWHLFGTALLTGIIFSFNMPARQAIIPQLVGQRQLMNAIALNSSGMNVTRIIAPVIAGFLIGIIGIPGVYIVVTCCYVVVIAAMLMLPTLGVAARPQKTSMMTDLIEGFVYVRHNPVILILLVIVFVTLIFGWPYMWLMPVFARDVLDIGAQGFGTLMSATGIGALVGSLAIASLVDFRRKGWLLLGLAFLFGAAVVLFASSTSLYLSFFFLFFVGLGSTGSYTMNNTLVLSNITEQVRGRVMAIYQMSFGLESLGALLVSAIAETMGAPLPVAGAAALMMLFIVAIAILMPGVRRLE